MLFCLYYLVRDFKANHRRCGVDSRPHGGLSYFRNSYRSKTNSYKIACNFILGSTVHRNRIACHLCQDLKPTTTRRPTLFIKIEININKITNNFYQGQNQQQYDYLSFQDQNRPTTIKITYRSVRGYSRNGLHGVFCRTAKYLVHPRKITGCDLSSRRARIA